ncbi:bifunctional sterol desaturase/short chain dehydrogenase [Aphanothece sacrum]|uniref:Fatty acid hydroxylase n=1 Tax=Aphanothece sacrum FPU1 TaxID=1920663 RepID=A0A401IP03_APHSA|nr:bifunctional sterol desaturase/short chain dehydrogenase [Aphanothece sacrum]GBF82956.1 fatty acid hydroxylase [Aphanothece sacrum FPU1]GBF86897.1 fatty acid hydroxylase [Aphanothece sacrum FPU3]
MVFNILTATTVILATILWVEIVRDSYHVLSHYWPPLYRLHIWHHRVFRPDLSPVSEEIYRKAHWYNDLPEALVMLTLSLLPGVILTVQNSPYSWVAWSGSIYTLTFLFGAIARGAGVPYADELTDLTHRQGDFTSLPAPWFVNRPYHWRHHFDNQKAYYCGTLTFVDKIMGTALSLKGKTIAVTGASGSLGLSLLKHLHLNGAKVIALTSQERILNIDIDDEEIPVKTLTWQVGKEAQLKDELDKIDILIINHGLNVHQGRSEAAIAQSYEVNTFSGWRLMELFFNTVQTNEDKVRKEVWVNTSEAEVNPAFSPLYELSKRTFGDLVTLRRLDAPCVVRKLILGPFKSNLNPIGVMSADWVAKQIVKGAKQDNRNIIVTINPMTFIAFPFKEFLQSLYFKIFTRSNQ